MKKFALLTLLGLGLLLSPESRAVIITVGPWQPIFKGVDLANGRQQLEVTGEFEQRVLCVRVDLTDPDVEFFPTPKCTNCGTYETVAQNTSTFLKQYGLQVAVNGMFYQSSSGASDAAYGTPEDVFGLAMSRGTIVSPANSSTYMAAVLLTTNKEAFFVPANSPPGTNTSGIYAAVSGSLAVLINGVNQYASNPFDRDPRTALGLSQDRRYLFLQTIDGRNPQTGPGWSNGADFHDVAEWLLRFGAWDGINIDGGGSTTMAMADCTGNPTRLNISSFVLQYGRERNVGHNVGIYARPLPSPLQNLTIQPGTTTAVLTWQTPTPSSTRVEYGTTTNYGSATALDPRLVRNHVATLTGLSPGSNYFFRAISSDGGPDQAQACSLITTSSLSRTLLFDVTAPWKYSTNNLDGLNWKSLTYDDSAWFGPSNGCFHIDNTAGSYPPRTTLLPPGFVVPIFRCYYFRKPFEFTGSTNGVTLTFSNYIDDGAVFYLNGNELMRYRVAAAPTVLSFTNFATGANPCPGGNNGDASLACPELFTISGTNLRQGANVIAVEVHNVSGGTTTQDILFGSGLFLNQQTSPAPQLFIASEGGQSTLYWNGSGLTLQRSTDLSDPAGWTDVPGPVTQSPFTVSQTGTTFYRLRN